VIGDEACSLKDEGDGLFEVESVEVKALGARCPALDLLDLFNELAENVNANLLDLLVVTLDRVQAGHEVVGDFGVAELRRSLDHLVTLDRHQAGENNDVLECAARMFLENLLKLIVGLDVEEELSHDEVRAGLDLLNQIGQVMLEALS